MAFSSCLFNCTSNKEKDTGPNSELAQISSASPGRKSCSSRTEYGCLWPNLFLGITPLVSGDLNLAARNELSAEQILGSQRSELEPGKLKHGLNTQQKWLKDSTQFGTKLFSMLASQRLLLAFPFTLASLIHTRFRFKFQCSYNLMISSTEQSHKCTLHWERVSLHCLWCGYTGYAPALSWPCSSSGTETQSINQALMQGCKSIHVYQGELFVQISSS